MRLMHHPPGRPPPRGCSAYAELSPTTTTIAFVADRLAAEAAITSRDLRDLYVATALHEAAHCLPLVASDHEARQRQSVDAGMPWDEDHGQRFLRVAAHLIHRAAQRGVHVDLADAMAGIGYGLSPASQYVAALAAECERMKFLLFSEIQSAPPPATFARLWQSDVRFWSSVISRSSERMNVFEELEACERERTAAYTKLVGRMAAGHVPAVKEVAEILSAAGKDAAALEADVATTRRRIHLRQEFGKVASLEAKQADLIRQIEVMNKKHEDAVAQHQAAVHPLSHEVGRLTHEILACKGLERELATVGGCPIIREQMAANRRHCEALRDNRKACQSHVHDMKARFAESKHRNTIFPGAYEADQAAHAAAVDRSERALVDVEQQIADAAANGDRLYQELLLS
jgi:hypothetical protein